MKLSSIMTATLATIDSSASLAEAARKMAAQDIGALPVCRARAVVGILTDRDITVRAVARGLDPVRTRVQDVMTPDALSIPADSDIERACELMERRRVRRIVVTDGDDAPVGIVSLGDIALCLREQTAGGVLRSVSTTERAKAEAG